MGDKIAENAVLDYATFQVSWSDNSYEALICSNGVIEKFDSGPLDQLAMHLTEARASRSNPSDASFKLQIDASIEASSWFTKFTLARFLHVVNVPNVLKLANAIENEIRQLEETRRFHIALYAKDNSNHFGGGATEVSYLNDAGLTQQIKVETASSDATKNDLLRAMDLRLGALKEDLVASFNRATGATCCTNQISDLASFAQHFGAVELSNLLLKFLKLCSNNLNFHTAMKQQTSLNDSGNINERTIGRFSLLSPNPDVVIPSAIVSPAKVAQAERQNSSESEDSSDSSDRDSPNGERSRPVIRSVAPRRSASPMRRIQIGRSGSRRSTAIAIKSLNYFPDREKTISNRDALPTESGDDETEHLPKKPENNVTRMSVQDAISLFERKQKDENVDIQNKKTSEVSINANKSVLRRWSAGMGGSSFNYSTEEKASDSCHQISSSNLNHEAEKKEDEMKTEPSNPENVQVFSSAETISAEPLKADTPTEPVVTSNVVEDKDCTSTEWNQQQEAELNEMLMKMTESSKSSKVHGTKVGNDGLPDTSIDQRGGFYSQYKEKRDEKLRAENARNYAAKQAQFKVMHETLEQSKAAMASTKTIKSVAKPESPNLSQKPRRNSSPPLLLKKELPKPTSTKNISPKSSSSPKTGSTLPSGPMKRKGGTPPQAKTSPVVSSSGMPSRQRSQSSNSPRQPSPKSDKPLSRVQGNKNDITVQTFPKPSLKGKEDKQRKTVAKNSKAVKPRSPLSVEDCGELSKPNVPNKHTKKSSVVPVESKPFLRKSPGIGLPVAKAKDARAEKSGDSSKISVILVQTEENESNSSLAVSTIKVIEDDLIQPTNVVNDETLAVPLDNDMYIETTENVDGSLTGTEKEIENAMIAEVQGDEDLGISSAAWVEAEPHEDSPSSINGLHGVVSPIIVPAVSSSSRVRHSLSQMLQAESGEPEIIEWGNAENPPSLVYQKDAPKGLKRLLKFARKSKGEGNSTGWSTPSVFSEGEEEHEESKAAIKTSEALLWKASLQIKGHGQPKSMVRESSDGGNSSKRAIDYRIVHDVSSDSSGSNKLRGGHISTGVTTTTTKATRSFFSLSSFRSSKSNTKKPR